MFRQPWKIIALFVFMLVAYAVWLNASTTSPTAALARIITSKTVQSHAELEPLLRIAAKEPRLIHWVHLLRGELLERDGKLDEAIAEYQKISTESAASLDRQIALLRLSPSNNTGEIIISLENRLSGAGREDLIPEVYFVRGILAEKSGELELAYSFYKLIREKYPRSETAKKARQNQYALEATYQKQLQSNSLPALMQDAKLLFLENELTMALQRIELAKKVAADKSAVRFEIMLLEEEILRKLNRNEEADHALLLISADGGLNSADVAMFRIAKNAWNINDHHRALTFIDNLKQRFAESPLLEEARYMEGRILEELSLFPESKEIYLSLAERSKNVKRRVLAFQRLAWMHMRTKNYSRAAEYFNKERLLAKSAQQETPLPTQESYESSLRTVKLDEALDHSTFWEAYCYLHAEPKDGLGSKKAEAEKLLHELVMLPPPNYYRSLAKQYLKEPMTGTNNLAIPASNSLSTCTFQPPHSLIANLSMLHGAELELLAGRELHWHFFKTFPDLHTVTQATITDASKQAIFTQLDLGVRYGQIHRAISRAEKLLKSTRDPKGLIKDTDSCLAVLEKLAFPTPYLTIFEDAANNFQISPSLLFSIARTESYFDRNAVSSAGALGLVQLMPETAKEEGLTVEQDISNPLVNVTLGTKHLVRLFDLFEKNEAYAIAAYNAGSAAVNRWKSREQNVDPALWIELIGYPETKDYVKKVLTAKDMYETILQKDLP